MLTQGGQTLADLQKQIESGPQQGAYVGQLRNLISQQLNYIPQISDPAAQFKAAQKSGQISLDSVFVPGKGNSYSYLTGDQAKSIKDSDPDGYKILTTEGKNAYDSYIKQNYVSFNGGLVNKKQYDSYQASVKAQNDALDKMKEYKNSDGSFNVGAAYDGGVGISTIATGLNISQSDAQMAVNKYHSAVQGALSSSYQESDAALNAALNPKVNGIAFQTPIFTDDKGNVIPVTKLGYTDNKSIPSGATLVNGGAYVNSDGTVDKTGANAKATYTIYYDKNGKLYEVSGIPRDQVTGVNNKLSSPTTGQKVINVISSPEFQLATMQAGVVVGESAEMLNATISRLPSGVVTGLKVAAGAAGAGIAGYTGYSTATNWNNLSLQEKIQGLGLTIVSLAAVASEIKLPKFTVTDASKLEPIPLTGKVTDVNGSTRYVTKSGIDYGLNDLKMPTVNEAETSVSIAKVKTSGGRELSPAELNVYQNLRGKSIVGSGGYSDGLGLDSAKITDAGMIDKEPLYKYSGGDAAAVRTLDIKNEVTKNGYNSAVEEFGLSQVKAVYPKVQSILDYEKSVMNVKNKIVDEIDSSARDKVAIVRYTMTGGKGEGVLADDNSFKKALKKGVLGEPKYTEEKVYGNRTEMVNELANTPMDIEVAPGGGWLFTPKAGVDISKLQNLGITPELPYVFIRDPDIIAAVWDKKMSVFEAKGEGQGAPAWGVTKEELPESVTKGENIPSKTARIIIKENESFNIPSQTAVKNLTKEFESGVFKNLGDGEYQLGRTDTNVTSKITDVTRIPNKGKFTVYSDPAMTTPKKLTLENGTIDRTSTKLNVNKDGSVKVTLPDGGEGYISKSDAGMVDYARNTVSNETQLNKVELEGKITSEVAENLDKAIRKSVEKLGYNETLNKYGLIATTDVYPYAPELALAETDEFRLSGKDMAKMMRGQDVTTEFTDPKSSRIVKMTLKNRYGEGAELPHDILDEPREGGGKGGPAIEPTTKSSTSTTVIDKGKVSTSLATELKQKGIKLADKTTTSGGGSKPHELNAPISAQTADVEAVGKPMKGSNKPSTGASPAGAPAKTPGVSPNKVPKQSPGNVPTNAPAKSPKLTPGQNPSTIPAPAPAPNPNPNPNPQPNPNSNPNPNPHPTPKPTPTPAPTPAPTSKQTDKNNKNMKLLIPKLSTDKDYKPTAEDISNAAAVKKGFGWWLFFENGKAKFYHELPDGVKNVQSGEHSDYKSVQTVSGKPANYDLSGHTGFVNTVEIRKPDHDPGKPGAVIFSTESETPVNNRNNRLSTRQARLEERRNSNISGRSSRITPPRGRLPH